MCAAAMKARLFARTVSLMHTLELPIEKLAYETIARLRKVMTTSREFPFPRSVPGILSRR